MQLHFIKGIILPFVNSLENFYEMVGVTIADRTSSASKLITSYPAKWMRHYCDNQYDNIDPVHVLGKKINTTEFMWGRETLPSSILSRSQQQMMEEASAFNVKSGITFRTSRKSNTILITTAFSHNEKITRLLSAGVIKEIRAQVMTLLSLIELENSGVCKETLEVLVASSNKQIKLKYCAVYQNQKIKSSLVELNRFLKQLPIALRAEGEYVLQQIEELLKDSTAGY